MIIPITCINLIMIIYLYKASLTPLTPTNSTGKPLPQPSVALIPPWLIITVIIAAIGLGSFAVVIGLIIAKKIERRRNINDYFAEMEDLGASSPIIRNTEAINRDWERQIESGRQVAAVTPSTSDENEQEWEEQIERASSSTVGPGNSLNNDIGNNGAQNNEIIEMSEEVEWDPSYDVEINQETSFCKYLPQQSRSYRCKRLIS